jgi:hypothetical protein
MARTDKMASKVKRGRKGWPVSKGRQGPKAIKVFQGPRGRPALRVQRVKVVHKDNPALAVMPELLVIRGILGQWGRKASPARKDNPASLAQSASAAKKAKKANAAK